VNDGIWEMNWSLCGRYSVGKPFHAFHH